MAAHAKAEPMAAPEHLAAAPAADQPGRTRSRSPRGAPAAPAAGVGGGRGNNHDAGLSAARPLTSHRHGDNPAWGTVHVKTYITIPTYLTCTSMSSVAATFEPRDIVYDVNVPVQPKAGSMGPPLKAAGAS